MSLNSLSVAGDIHTPNKFGKTPSARGRTRCVAANVSQGDQVEDPHRQGHIVDRGEERSNLIDVDTRPVDASGHEFALDLPQARRNEEFVRLRIREL